ncbi:hypothetical protein HPP92_006220 [Vanilla planifolia]|uniref:Uncharacterized protein n=1 Tax=Vanilla planifolia TaxID=51239 RepID=A0A835RVI2_VANPL|nr:hypothetical protein HPP92_006220 [Vanilla planifolia]
MGISAQTRHGISNRSSTFSLRFYAIICVVVSASLVASFLFLIPFYHSTTATSTFSFSSVPSSPDLRALGFPLLHRRVLAAKPDPLRLRVEQIRKQTTDHAALASAYASYARKLKLENSKQLRLFADVSRNFSLLISDHRHLLDPSHPVDESLLRRFEREVKDRIRAARAPHRGCQGIVRQPAQDPEA